ncbi:MAG: tRNA adenosine(34) deaminase TadA [Clostridia bacterium]|nr:tRNA adenosine(34) deaminase TadA [Clostridia bacterium]
MTEQERFMKEAIKEAKKGLLKDEVPVGAVLVSQGKIIARAYNKRQEDRDATAHAEIICIKKACKKFKDFRLIDCELYVTLEPCLMCFGAILNARIKKVYFGASINKEGSIDCEEIIARAELNHKCEIEKGLFEEECSNLVSDYFKSKRKKIKEVL